MKKISLLALLLSITIVATAQVSKTIMVEHFTNSVCSVCNILNPGILSNIDNQGNIIHLSIHPSKPYDECLFSQQNPTEQDNRAIYYNIFNATPRLVINGQVIQSGTDYSADALYDSYENQTSPISITMLQTKQNDQLDIEATITTEASNDLQDLRLHVMAVERVVDYNAPNGEMMHHDVFRQLLTEDGGIPISLESGVGESVQMTLTKDILSNWVKDEMYAIAFVQNEVTKEIIQSSATTVEQDDLVSVTDTPRLEVDWAIYPNPAQEELWVEINNAAEFEATIYNQVGVALRKGTIQQKGSFDIGNLPVGIYFIKIENEAGFTIEKLNKL